MEGQSQQPFLVLVVSSNDDRDSIMGVLAVGAAGFVPKSSGP
jgi:DNA-binding NarL/FixJ family response regulator